MIPRFSFEERGDMANRSLSWWKEKHGKGKEKRKKRRERETPIPLSVPSWTGGKGKEDGLGSSASGMKERAGVKQLRRGKNLETLTNPWVDSSFSLRYLFHGLSSDASIPFLRVSFRFNTVGDYRSRAPTSPFLSEEQNRRGGDD